MDTAARVAVRSFFRPDHRAVCVSSNQQAVVFDRPVSQQFFGMFFSGVVFGGAGWIWDTEFFQRAPDITDQKSGKRPESAVEEICLVSVSQTNIFFLVCILQNNAGIERNAGTKRVFTVLFTAPGAKIFT